MVVESWQTGRIPASTHMDGFPVYQDLAETHQHWITSFSLELMSKRLIPMLTVLVSCVVLCTAAPAATGQEPIRVQAKEVLVPVFVLDEGRFRDLLRSETLAPAVLAGDAALVDHIVEGIVIRDLTAADFEVYEDGKMQAVENVVYERSLYWDVRDNAGHHTEYIGPGGGKWSTAEWPSGLAADLDPPHYLVAYVPPESADGSCHQIKVKVNRQSTFIASRSEYCNTSHSPTDPLKGTTLGAQLESDLAAPKNNDINISVLAIPFYSSSDPAHVRIALDWPWQSLRGKARSKGVLGMVFRKDGSFVTRFSDVADRYGVPDSERIQWRPQKGDRPQINLIENRYDGQLKLAPGDYEVRVALGDGTRFGRAEVPLTVDSYSGRILSISAVSLCKQISDVSANARRLSGAWTAKLTGDYVPLVSNETEFKPTSNTRFKARQNLYVYFEIYEPVREGTPQLAVEFQIRIVDLKTGELRTDPQPISAMPYSKTDSSIIPVGRGINISKLPKGSYRLDVRATDSTGQSTDWRSVNFTVE